MRDNPDWIARVRSAFDASSLPDADVIEELAQHARAAYEAARADGLTHEEANVRVADLLQRWQRDAALLSRRRRSALIDPPPIASSSRLAGFENDLRYAARLVARQRRASTLVILTMALGIGVTTVLFSVTYGVLMRPLPWPHADRIVTLTETRGGRPPRFGALTNVAYAAWRDEARTIDGLAAWSRRAVTLAADGDPERIQVVSASASLFPLLGVSPLTGSLFTGADERANVVLLSERLWRRAFDADRAAVGRLVKLDGQPFRITGVISDVAAWPDRRVDAWTPFAVAPVSGNSLSLFSAIARLRPGVTADQAAAEGTARGRFVPDTAMTTTAIFGGNGAVEIGATPLFETLTGDVRLALVVLMAGVALLLVAATANIAGLQAARATARRREMAIRVAIGAGGWRLARQLLLENLLLGLGGGVFGVLLAWWMHGALPAVLPADFPRVDDIRLDFTVAAVALIAALGTSLAFGWLPARRASREDAAVALAEDGTSPSSAWGPSRTAQARTIIMAAQVAITCVLLLGAALLGRGFVGLLSVDRGYEPTGVYTTAISLPASLYSPERRYDIVSQTLARLRVLPGVEAGMASELPITPGGSTAAFTLRSPIDGGEITAQASPRLISAGAFAALGMHVVEGRAFTDTDTETSAPVAIVNRGFSRKFLGGRALDTAVPMGIGYENPSRSARVVGVVEDVRYVGAGDSSLPEVYYSYRQLGGQLPVPVATLLMRTTMDRGTVRSTVQSALRAIDATLAPGSVLTLDDRLSTSLARPRLYAVALGAFAGCALLLAAVGLFAVLSYSVAQRTRELALRVALGANPGHLRWLVLRQGLAITAAGLVPGLLVASLLTPALGSLLHGVAPHDRLAYLVVTAIVGAVALLACVGPIRRAARLDTLRALNG
jgi:predicted permease